MVSARNDATQFPVHIVGRNDNSVTSSGTPAWDYNGVLDLMIDISK